MKVLKWLDKYFEEAVLVVLLCLMMLIMGIQVTARYALGSSLSWSEEITRYLFIWSGFLSASFCVKKGASVKIEQLVSAFPRKVTHLLRVVSYTIEIIFFTYLIPFAVSYVQSAVTSRQLSPACSIPMYFIQLSTLFSFVLCDIRLVQKMVQRIQILTGRREDTLLKSKEEIMEELKEEV
ncbi:MAG: TRAP transporter small permease [Hespellia sp.]|nr:TRAP transporter small permease [Hespellia sp.]